MTMFKNHVTQNLSAYLHGEMSAESAMEVQSHLVDCSSCRNALEEIRFSDRLVSTLRPVEAPESIWNEIHSARQNPHRPYRALAAGFAVAVVLTISLFLHSQAPDKSVRGDSSSWEVASIRGTSRIGNVQLTGTGRLRPGDFLQTSAQSEAEVKIADIGQLNLDPNSRIRLISSNSDQHRIALERGRMTARTWSPPRLFVVETPSSTAVDLGCIYSCEVQRDGSTLLHVTLGLVALDFHGRETVVPAGAYCHTRPGGGVGTPYFDDSSEQLQTALNYVDFGKDEAERSRQLDIVLREARPRDTLTLWYLIPRLKEPLRAVTVDRMATLVPLPKTVTRSGVMTLNADMMDSWKSELERVW
jgi:ferric-dicitrate binding protein FerR (iron transport regulator)